ncbi:AraC family transcriptional regulator [Opitutaceae bacterium TAV5]|nr:AraC family transcriptional regulator [Opitutaceae bacterium TAV5]
MSTSAPLERPLRFGDWAHIRHALIWAYEGPVWPASAAGTYSSNDMSCWLIRRGRVTLTTAGKSLTARAGQWAFVSTPTRHQAFSKDAELLSLHFNFTWPGGEPVIAQPRTVVFDADEHPQLERAALPMVRLVRRHFPKAHAFLPAEFCSLPLYLRVQKLLPAWLEAWLAAQAVFANFPQRLGLTDDRILQALAELDRWPLGQKFSECELVRRTGLGRSQLNALFVRSTGTTPRRYLERRRLEAAERLLGHTQMSVKEIGIDLGFRYESHFSQWFRAHRSAAPSAWRAAR